MWPIFRDSTRKSINNQTIHTETRIKSSSTRKKTMSRNLVRHLHINAAPSATIPSSVVIQQQAKASSQQLPSTGKKPLETPRFQALGTPPTLANIALTPSLPVYIRKNSLLSLYGSQLHNISTTRYFLEPFKRIFTGFHSFQYEKLESTVPSTLLVSSLNSQSSISTLSLNGSVDWAIFPRNSLLAYSGANLHVSTEFIPKHITKTTKWYQLSSNTTDKTGLFTPWQYGYSLISGRGDVVLNGEGSIFKIVLEQNEQIAIKRNNILGISVNGDELSRCTQELQGLNQSQAIPALEQEVALIEQTKFQQQWQSVKSFFGRIFSTLVKYLSNSTQNYVQISGPRTLLIQTSLQSSDYFTKEQRLDVAESKISKAAKSTKTEDYLSYAIVKDGNVTFHSTPDFSKTVDKIESLKPKKE